jgi:hypothetical protein
VNGPQLPAWEKSWKDPQQRYEVEGRVDKGTFELVVDQYSRFMSCDAGGQSSGENILCFIPAVSLEDCTSIKRNSVLDSADFEYLWRKINECIRNRGSFSSNSRSEVPKWLIDCQDMRIVTASSSMRYIAFGYVWALWQIRALLDL